MQVLKTWLNTACSSLTKKCGKNIPLLLNLGRSIGIIFPSILSVQKNTLHYLHYQYHRKFHRQVHKYAKNKDAFTIENALFKFIYVLVKKYCKNGTSHCISLFRDDYLSPIEFERQFYQQLDS